VGVDTFDGGAWSSTAAAANLLQSPVEASVDLPTAGVGFEPQCSAWSPAADPSPRISSSATKTPRSVTVLTSTSNLEESRRASGGTCVSVTVITDEPQRQRVVSQSSDEDDSTEGKTEESSDELRRFIIPSESHNSIEGSASDRDNYTIDVGGMVDLSVSDLVTSSVQGLSPQLRIRSCSFDLDSVILSDSDEDEEEDEVANKTPLITQSGCSQLIGHVTVTSVTSPTTHCLTALRPASLAGRKVEEYFIKVSIEEEGRRRRRTVR
jgi:hypothetical protein